MCPPFERRRGLGERGDASRGLCRFITWFFPKDAVGKDGEVSRRSGFVGEGRPRFFGGSLTNSEVISREGSVAKFDGWFPYCPDRGIAPAKSYRLETLHDH